MAAAQNVRSGSSPGPTHDPDLRSRPPIQTFRKDLIQTFDPDLWNDIIWYIYIMYWWVDVWSSDGCMFLGFPLCSYPPCQAAKRQTVAKLRCQAVKLPSCTCRKATLLSSQAVQQPSCNCCASKLSNCKADTVASCKASLPSSQAVPCCPHTLSSFSCHAASKLQHTQTCGPTSGPIQTRIQTIQTRSRPQPAPIQTTTSSVLKLVIVWFLSFLQTLGSHSIDFGTHVNGSKSPYSQIESEVWTL